MGSRGAFSTYRNRAVLETGLQPTLSVALSFRQTLWVMDSPLKKVSSITPVRGRSLCFGLVVSPISGDFEFRARADGSRLPDSGAQ